MTIEKGLKDWMKRELLVREVPIEDMLNKLIELIDLEFDKIESFIKERLRIWDEGEKSAKEGGD